MLTPKQGGRRPYHSKDLSCHLGQSYLVAPQGATRTKVNLSKNMLILVVLISGHTFFSLFLFTLAKRPLPLTTVRFVTNPEDLPWGRWPLDSRSQVVLLKSVVSFSFLLQASKDRTVLFFFPPPHSCLYPTST